MGRTTVELRKQLRNGRLQDSPAGLSREDSYPFFPDFTNGTAIFNYSGVVGAGSM